MAVVQSPGKNFGTSWLAKEVQIRDLEPGVVVDGWVFGSDGRVTVEEIEPHEGTLTGLRIAQSEDAHYLHPDRKIAAWGRI